MSARGSGLTEGILALVLLTLLVQGALTLLSRQRRAAATLVVWEEGMEAVGIARWILGDELRAGVAGRDWSAPRADTLGLRAFRGTALVCPLTGEPGRILVHHRGVRNPDPEKDSVLLLDEAGRWWALDLEAREAASDRCPGAPAVGTEWWTLSGLPENVGPVARLFERGSYHLADGALRYRRGRGGRQPLTPPLLDPASRLRAGEGGGVVVDLLVPGGSGMPWGGSWTLWPREAAP